MDRPSDVGNGALFKNDRKEKPSHLDYQAGRDVILYHFTELKNVEAIKREGLRAAPQKDIEGVMNFVGGGDLPVVYLCDTPTSAVTDTELEEFRRACPEDDIVSKRWMLAITNEPLARLTVRLPSHDRNLKQYGQWLRANYHRNPDALPHPDDPWIRRAITTWWLYFDHIAPSSIIDCSIEPATPAEPAKKRRVGYVHFEPGFLQRFISRINLGVVARKRCKD